MTSREPLAILESLTLESLLDFWGRTARFEHDPKSYRKRLWAHLVSPVDRGFLLLLRKCLAHDGAEETLQYWLHGQSREVEEIIAFGDSRGYPSLRGVFRGHLHCALACWWARQWFPADPPTAASAGRICRPPAPDAPRVVRELVHNAIAAVAALEEVWGQPSLSGRPDGETLSKEVLVDASTAEVRGKAARLIDVTFRRASDRLQAGGRPSVALLRDLAQELLHDQRPSPRAHDWEVNEPFALVSPKVGGRPKGILARFVLQRVPGGHGSLFPAAEQAFLLMDRDFRRFFCEGPQALLRCFPEMTEIQRYDVRVRLEFLKPRQRGGSPLIRVPLSGPSAGGAAGRGACFAFSGKVPDQGVIVLAQMNPQGTLEPITPAPVAPKVAAIAHHRGFDTIVVTRGDLQDAKKALGHCGQRFDVEPDEKDSTTGLFCLRLHRR